MTTILDTSFLFALTNQGELTISLILQMPRSLLWLKGSILLAFVRSIVEIFRSFVQVTAITLSYFLEPPANTAWQRTDESCWC